MGGRRLPPGDNILMADGAARPVLLPESVSDSRDEVRVSLASFGIAKVMGEPVPRLGSDA